MCWQLTGCKCLFWSVQLCFCRTCKASREMVLFCCAVISSVNVTAHLCSWPWHQIEIFVRTHTRTRTNAHACILTHMYAQEKFRSSCHTFLFIDIYWRWHAWYSESWMVVFLDYTDLHLNWNWWWENYYTTLLLCHTCEKDSCLHISIPHINTKQVKESVANIDRTRTVQILAIRSSSFCAIKV